MLHPDYQYNPKLIPSMASLLAEGIYPVVLGKGQRLFDEGTTATLNLVEARALSGGVTALIYEPKRS